MMLKRAIVTTIACSVFAVGCQAHPSVAETIGASAALSADKAGAGTGAALQVSLTDISDHWAKDAVLQAVRKGYVNGYEDGTFRPDNNITRAEFIKMLVVATGEKTAGAGQIWYEPYLNTASELGIYHSDDDFPADQVDAPLTRAEMAKLAVRAVDKDSRPKAAHLYDMTAMTKAVNLGIIQGLSGGELGLNERTTRAQSVTIIERVLTVIGGGKLPADKYALGNIELATKKTNIFTVIPEFFGGKQLDGYTWNPDNLVLETPDGKWKGELEQLVAIDLDDPNDPNLSLLPDINTLHFFNFNGPENGPLVKDFPHSYILLYKSEVIYNKDHSVYADWIDHMTLEISGFETPDENALENGVLNTIATVFQKRDGDMTAYIIPKSALTSKTIYMSVRSPAIAPNPQYDKTILGVGVADKTRLLNK